MPCVSEPYTQEEMNAYGDMSRGQFEAVLCGVLSIDESVLDRVDWKEVGVSRQLADKWWRRHKAEDKKRRAEEAAAAERAEERMRALAKLTTSEIKALGLK